MSVRGRSFSLLLTALAPLGLVTTVSLCQAHPSAATGDSAERSALAHLAQRVAQGLHMSDPALVAVGPIETSRKTPSKTDLAKLHQKIRSVVASAVPLVHARISEPVPFLKARTMARRDDVPLVFMQPSLRGGTLLLTVDVLQWPRSFWQRARNPEGNVLQHLSSSVEADAEIRRFLPAPSGLLRAKKAFPNPVASPLALACGDTDGDGGQELVVVGRRRIMIGSFEESTLVPSYETTWDTWSPISPTPLRAPLAAATVSPGVVTLGLSDRMYGLRLEVDESAKEVDENAEENAKPPNYQGRRIDRAYPTGDDQCLQFSATGLNPEARSCDRNTSSRPPEEHEDSIAAWIRTVATDPQGIPQVVTLTSPVDEAKAHVEVRSPTSQARSDSLTNTGAQFAVADLDGDGTVEVLSTRASEFDEQDAIVIHSWQGDGLRQVAAIEARPVHALTTCPFFGTNPLTTVAAVGRELWVLR